MDEVTPGARVGVGGVFGWVLEVDVIEERIGIDVVVVLDMVLDVIVVNIYNKIDTTLTECNFWGLKQVRLDRIWKADWKYGVNFENWAKYCNLTW